mmetsp:Transcript_122897/g.348355  ORF Transcript_122897/g.348355 Transcript_122897/m.348355 type:complete len:270 (-) Transcript_122897:306-1115(-)
MILKSLSPTICMRTSPSSMRGRRRWSTSWPPASLPPLKYWPGKVAFHSPAAPPGPSTQKARNSPSGWNSTWLSFISMNLSMSSSSRSSAPRDPQYGATPPLGATSTLSSLGTTLVLPSFSSSLVPAQSAFLIFLPSFISSHTSQMPSPADPRFCLMTRGWKAQVFRMPSFPTKCSHLPSSWPKYVNVSGRPHDSSRMLVSASFAPICVCTPGDDHTGTFFATRSRMDWSKRIWAPSFTPGAESCPGLMRTMSASNSATLAAKPSWSSGV